MGRSSNSKQQNDMEWRVSGVEGLLKKYKFENKKLLEEALTHPSCSAPKTPSYQRLEFIGDAVLTLAFSEFFFCKYPKLGEGQLTLLQKANTTNEKLARVAIRHGLYSFLRTTATAQLDQQVKEFALTVQQREEVETMVYGGTVYAPKVLADIVESVVGAIYFDCGSDLKVLWQVTVDLLKPIVTPATLPPHPVTKVFELFQKQGKRVRFKEWEDRDLNMCCIYVDEKPFTSGCSDHSKDIAKLNAAKEALLELNLSDISRIMATSCPINELNENEPPSQLLHNLCAQKKWVKPDYRVVEEKGPDHDKKFKYSVKIETESGPLFAVGDGKSNIAGAKSSAASSMIQKLKESYLSIPYSAA